MITNNESVATKLIFLCIRVKNADDNVTIIITYAQKATDNQLSLLHV